MLHIENSTWVDQVVFCPATFDWCCGALGSGLCCDEKEGHFLMQDAVPIISSSAAVSTATFFVTLSPEAPGTPLTVPTGECQPPTNFTPGESGTSFTNAAAEPESPTASCKDNTAKGAGIGAGITAGVLISLAGALLFIRSISQAKKNKLQSQMPAPVSAFDWYTNHAPNRPPLPPRLPLPRAELPSSPVPSMKTGRVR
ncbi:MAG: hypothetical protein M1837_000877 [Sclerophora amabilis]|nr:MAG: hypothetical protein M1837_000877 [Sclerophora amabilis]